MFKKKLKLILFKIILITPLIFLLYSCDTGSNTSDSGIVDVKPKEWLINKNEVMDGGPGKDGIPALTDPILIPVGQAAFMDPEDLVIAVRTEDKIIAFPHKILDQHEIINILSTAVPFVLSYCPLTGSGMVWKAPTDANDKSYGVSGLLYNSNLILYDRETDSHWSQMMMKCVNGALIGENANMLHLLETKWATWIEMYPNSLVVSNATGSNRSYEVYPYGGYKTSDTLVFSVNNVDNRLHKKRRIHGIISGDTTKAYVIDNYTGSVTVINEAVNGIDIVLAINDEKNFAVSFERTLEDGTQLTFSSVQESLPIIMEDNEGTKWNIFGFAVSGPRIGSHLTPTLSYNAYWFAWAAFFPDPIL